MTCSFSPAFNLALWYLRPSLVIGLSQTTWRRIKEVILEGVRANYQALFGGFSGPGQSSLSSKVKNKIWADITRQINATGSGQWRSVEQVRLRWKNLKQKATKDHSEAKNPQTGNKSIKRGEFTDTVLDIIGGESSQALFGILPAGTGESIDPTEPLNLSAELVTLTPVELAFEEPSTSQSPVLEEMWNPPAPPPPCKRKRQAEKGDGNNELLKVETERAQQQIILTNEQIKLTLLKQEEVKLRIQLLEKQLKD